MSFLKNNLTPNSEMSSSGVRQLLSCPLCDAKFTDIILFMAHAQTGHDDIVDAVRKRAEANVMSEIKIVNAKSLGEEAEEEDVDEPVEVRVKGEPEDVEEDEEVLEEVNFLVLEDFVDALLDRLGGIGAAIHFHHRG